MASRRENNVVYAAGMAQGIVLVTFPAASAVFTDPDKYDSALNYQDDQLGRLFDAIDARGDKDETTVILYSDHGELFGEHGYSRHGFTLYQPDVHVLLLVRTPGGHVPTIDTPMFLSDLTPTIFELTGQATVYGTSFSHTLAPGLRVGVFVLPNELAAELGNRATSTYITPPLLAQATVFEFLRR